jgi:hypothetical protein
VRLSRHERAVLQSPAPATPYDEIPDLRSVNAASINTTLVVPDAESGSSID